MALEQSILTSIKKPLGLEKEYAAFDADIIIHINTVLLVLDQLAVGPEKVFHIEDDTAKWSDFLGEDSDLQYAVQTYVYLKVRLIFDPPTVGAVIEAMKETIRELEFRLNIQAEEEAGIT